jgi:hypothetical protein
MLHSDETGALQFSTTNIAKISFHKSKNAIAMAYPIRSHETTTHSSQSKGEAENSYPVSIAVETEDETAGAEMKVRGDPKVRDMPFQSMPGKVRWRGHARLKYIVWESSLAIGQHAIVRVLTLKKLSARDITAELEGAYGHEVLSHSVVKKWHNRFANARFTREYDPQSGRPPQSDLCESLRTLVDEAPFISCKYMRQKLRIPKTTCVCILHQGLWFRKCCLKWVLHSMTES